MSSERTLLVVLIAILTVTSFWRFVANNVTYKSDYFHSIVFRDNDIDSIVDPESSKNITEDVKLEPNFIDFYHNGVQSYLENDWEACINHFERSLNLYKQYTEAVANCRVQCEFERVKFRNTHEEDYDHIHFYEKLIVKTLCLEKCRQKTLTYLPRYFVLDDVYTELFKIRKPYEYLQMCYYKEGQLDKAISATYTVLVANPGDELMNKNIQFHAKQKDFNWDHVKDLEEKRYSTFYQDGIEKYELKEWKEAIELLEIAIDLWLQEHDKCRAMCEKSFDQGWFPDFTTSVSNHYVATLRCKQNCTRQLSFANGRFFEDLYPSMYNYLQFAYYNAGKMLEASRSAASFLLFEPNSQQMLTNVEYYKNENLEKSALFLKPRKEAEQFAKRANYEAELLSFVDQEFYKLSKEPFRPQPQMDHLTDREIDDVDKANLIDSLEQK